MEWLKHILTLPLFFLGAVLGTFLTTCIERLPFQEEDLDEEDLPDRWYYKIPLFSLFISLPLYTRFSSLIPRAQCPACRVKLPWTERLAMVSFIRQRGRCSHCFYKIPGRHLFVEACTAVSFALAFWIWGLTPSLIVALILIPLFIVATVVDLRFQIIPDEVSAAGIVLGLAWTALWTLHYGFSIYSDGWTGGFLEFLEQWFLCMDEYSLAYALSGFLVGSGALWLFYLLGSAYAGTDAMGFGDVKLAAFIGLFLGPLNTVIALAWAMTLGAIAGIFIKVMGGGRAQGGYTAFAFGPYICAGALIVLYVGSDGPLGVRIQNTLFVLNLLLRELY